MTSHKRPFDHLLGVSDYYVMYKQRYVTSRVMIPSDGSVNFFEMWGKMKAILTSHLICPVVTLLPRKLFCALHSSYLQTLSSRTSYQMDSQTKSNKAKEIFVPFI